MKTELKIAQEIAREAHLGQERKDGKDYITHPKAVAKSLKLKEEKIVAWLHDVLEDSDFTSEDLIERGISPYLVSVVELLTRKKNQNYLNYILRIGESRIAIQVKLADLDHNLSNLEKGNMRDKYQLAFYILRLPQIMEEELKWLDSFKESTLKYYKFQNAEYNQKIEERIKYLGEKLIENEK